MPKWLKRLLYYWAYDTVRSNIERFQYWEHLLTEINPDALPKAISTTAGINLPKARVDPTVHSFFPFEHVGDQLVCDFREFKVFVNPSLEEVFVEGVAVKISSSYKGHKKWCNTRWSSFTFDHEPATRPIASLNVLGYNPDTGDFAFTCEGIKLLVNRKKRFVTVWDATIGGTNVAGFEMGYGPASSLPAIFREIDHQASNITAFPAPRL